MSDPLASSRLPDIPNAGYATSTQKQLSDAIMFLLRGMERDRYLLLETVLRGRERFRHVFLTAYRFIKADTEFADAVFGYLVILADAGGALKGPQSWEAQKARLEQSFEQSAIQSYDRRFRTALKHSKERQNLEQDIMRDVLKASKRSHTVN